MHNAPAARHRHRKAARDQEPRPQGSAGWEVESVCMRRWGVTSFSRASLSVRASAFCVAWDRHTGLRHTQCGEDILIFSTEGGATGNGQAPACSAAATSMARRCEVDLRRSPVISDDFR